jgi:hypothetical protein
MMSDLPPPGTAEEPTAVDLRVRTLGASYLAKLHHGAVVEELISGEIRSPAFRCGSTRAARR